MAMLTPDMGRPQRDVVEYQFPTGIYLVRLRAGSYESIKKIVFRGR